MTFAVRVAVRGYELDTQGHLNNVVHHQYGDHARWECLLAAGIGPVTLENTIRFRRELRGGGLMDLRERRLLDEPGARRRALARAPEVLNL